ncbi:AfsR/SARP family transcriptional regulator [Actinomadura atramentaria]|uniref:AfsR/SARP family transcriptional regulator n=1 Tax=Actinomadura atramentaria TaxID=1990 RepID=UPI00036AC22F|nr:BTAD domain-containing putative transcriptional regulator [Actinomadura atramentaria]
MRIAILGPLEVTADGRPVAVGGARLRALAALLALDAGRPVAASALVDALWGDDVPAAAPAALQSLVSRLRAAIGRDLIPSGPAGYRLAVPPDAVDAHVFQARLAAARRAPSAADRAAGLRAALALWRGPALADALGRPAADARAARLEGLRRAALDERADADLDLGRHAELIPELQALAAAEPLREPLRARLIRALYGAGRQAEALAEYAALRRTLADELGVDPSPELASLHAALLRQDPTLNAASGQSAPTPPNETHTARPGPWEGGAAWGGAADADGGSGGAVDAGAGRWGNLRAPLTSFVGRDVDLERVAALLAAGRLVTLTGPGGAGKTRLSLEAGARAAAGGAFPHGVWSVELAPVADAAEVPAAVAAALRLRETVSHGLAREPLPAPPAAGPGGAADPLDRVVRALAGRRLLLVLDNCEHLLDAAARLADRVLAECPGVSVLATSREPLGITGEALWPVGPLAVPPGPANPGANPGANTDPGADVAADPSADADTSAGAGAALAYPAVRLLAERAAAVAPGFAVTSANAADVRRICRALDGVPLAIELAAARLRALTPAQVADRLDDRFRLLRAGSRTALPRHRTLRAVVDWSWDLLTGPERALWRRLAVFHGGATPEAAEHVGAGGELDGADVLDVLTALVDKSLLTVDTASGAPRYGMLETIRAYGLDRLAESGEADAVRRAHADFFLALAEDAAPHLTRAEQLVWLDRLSADHDNLNAALRRTIAAGDAPRALRFCAALGWYWFMRGRIDESREHTAQATALPDVPRDETTARALAYAAIVRIDGEHAWEGVGLLREAHAITAGNAAGRPAHPVLRVAAVICDLLADGWDESALNVRREPMASLRALQDDPDPWVRGVAHFVEGQLGHNFGRTESLEEHFARSERAFRESGDRWGLAFALDSRAELLGRRGAHAAAVRVLEETLALQDALGEGQGWNPHSRAKLANALFLSGRRDRAADVLRTAHRRAEREGSTESVAILTYRLGELALRLGRPDEARARLARAEELAGELPGPPQFRALVQTTRGHLDLASGAADAARRRFDDAIRAAASSLDHPVIAHVLGGQAALALHDGDPERAADLLGAAEALRGAPDLALADVTAVETAVRAALGPDAFAAARARGATRTLADVLDLFGLPRPDAAPRG